MNREKLQEMIDEFVLGRLRCRVTLYVDGENILVFDTMGEYCCLDVSYGSMHIYTGGMWVEYLEDHVRFEFYVEGGHETCGEMEIPYEDIDDVSSIVTDGMGRKRYDW